MATTTWSPSTEIDVTSGGLTSVVIYRSYIENTAYSNADGTQHILMGSTALVYKNSDTDVVYLNITKVNYDKQVYKPGKLTITMTMTDGSDSTKKTYGEILKKIFLTKECSVDFVTTTEDSTYFTIARFYYVKKLSLGYSDGTAIVTMTCYSPDYKLTLDKFCRVYNGKKFAKEIFPDVVTAIKKDGTAVFSACSDTTDVEAPSYYADIQNLLYLSYTQSEMMSSATFTADESSQQDGNNSSSENSVQIAELMQPYLVQYNESSYDFLARVANRCGEFMYYENGVLWLGLPETTRDSMSTGKAHTTLSPDNTTYPELSLDEDTGLDPQLNFFNYLESGKSIVAEAKKNYLNVGNSADESLYQYQLKQDDDIPSINPMADSYLLVATMSTFVSGTSALPALLSAVIGTLAVMLLKTKTSLMGYRKYQLEAYDAIYESKTNEEKATAINDLYANLCNAFYQHISDCEKDAGRKAIVMDFDDQLPVTFLGDTVTNSDGLNDIYVVTAIRGEYSLSGHKHYVEAVPMMTKPEGETIRSYADGAALIVPPYAVEHKLRGVPQEAVVRDTNDPLLMGRVRVTYLWQDADNIEIEEDNYSVSTDTTHSSEGFTPWLRMITPYSGNADKHGGILMTPSTGSHVMVGYFNDNMEEPFVQSALYYENQSAPGFGMERDNRYPGGDNYKPTAQVRTIQSESGHSITFIDNPETSFITDHVLPLVGQPLTLLSTLASTLFGLDLESDLDSVNGGALVLSDKSGFYKISMNADTRDVSISSPLGTVNVNAFTGINITAPNGDINIVGKNVNIKAGNNLNIEAGTNISRDENPRNTAQTLVAGITGAVAGLANILPTILIYSSFDAARFVDFTFIRAFWEVINRPVSGTLSISTPRNVAVTAGKGRTVIPAYLLSNKGDNGAHSLATNDNNPVVRVNKVLALARMAIDEYYNRKLKLYLEVAQHVDKLYRKLTSEQTSKTTVNKFVDALNTLTTGNAITIKNRLMSDARTPKTKQALVASFKNGDELAEKLGKVKITTFHGLYHHYANNLASEYNAGLEAYTTLCNMGTDSAGGLVYAVNKRLEYCKKLYFLTEIQIVGVTQEVSCLTGNNGNAPDLQMYDGNDPRSVNVKVDNDNRLAITTEVMYRIMLKLGDYFTFDDTINVVVDNPGHNTVNQANWMTFIDSIKLKAFADPGSHTSGLEKWFGASEAIDTALKSTKIDELLKLGNWNGCAGPRASSDITTGGRILMSSSPDKTMMTNDSGTGMEALTNPTVNTIKDYLRMATMGQAPQNEPQRDPGILWDPDSDIYMGVHGVGAANP